MPIRIRGVAVRSASRLLAFAAGAFALSLQYMLVATSADSPGLVTWTVKFFSFFTILTNSLAALAMVLPVVAACSAPGRLLNHASVRSAIAGSILIVAAVYFLILRHTWNPEGRDRAADQLLNYATPALSLGDWLILVPTRSLRWSDAPKTLVLPAAYILRTFAHGAATGWYPYPFVDVLALGYPVVLVNVALLFGVFLAVAAGLVAADRLLGRSGVISLAP